MIAKHIPINSLRKSNFAGLVNYIVDPQNKTERIGMVRAVNCYSDRPDCVIAEVLNTQQMNMRATSDKTYHLVVSFRDDDLSDTLLQKIEDQLCEGLGFGEHQRFSVVHHDTDHLHIHIAINKIHPERLTIHNPHYDYSMIAELCEKLEQDYGLTPDNHETIKRGAQGKSSNIEFKAGVESLIGWMQQECLEQMQSATTWSELHQVLTDHGLELRERGNGFVFVSGNGIGVKASSVDRSLSKATLVKKLGDYVGLDGTPSINRTNKPSTKHYEPKPLRNKHDTARLYAQYKKEQNEAAISGAQQWKLLRDKKHQAIESAQDKAKLKRLLIKNVTAGRLSKKIMYASVNQELKLRIEAIKKDYAAAYQDSKAKNRRMDWLSWLVKESRLGNQEALEILRARKEGRVPENQVAGVQKHADSAKADVIETITRTGTIICTIGSTAIRDGGNGLVIMAGAAKDKIAGILQAAMQQYGNKLAINGSESFRKKVVQVAMDAGLDVTFEAQDHSIHHSVKPHVPLTSIRSTHKGKGKGKGRSR
ncbi:relaxase/mobilization nuclease-like protein [Nitrosomonas sp. Nm84]|uniref:TraI/MobA(P) family conjugative relaxase n=1 Tax=Nitrosomonas sp. Nm84 TaxID=200124 RepID=UPI000D768002|nr:TraI/MobA(P) family conjugative relaxase [Nitrosomonas sp. Nm84]PXW89113.1 relaxase/mobilization nuclease-like protein [Nitrosomonas sp. Nm84]